MNHPLIRRRRELLGLTQRQVADALGIERASVANWERGAANVDRKHLLKLAEVLQTTTDELLADPEEKATA